jgi:hypothetical protein
LNNAGGLEKVSLVATETTLRRLEKVYRLNFASKVIASVSTLNNPIYTLSLACIKQTHIFSLAAHFLVLMSVEFTIITYFHHLWNGIRGDDDIGRFH